MKVRMCDKPMRTAKLRLQFLAAAASGAPQLPTALLDAEDCLMMYIALIVSPCSSRNIPVLLPQGHSAITKLNHCCRVGK